MYILLFLAFILSVFSSAFGAQCKLPSGKTLSSGEKYRVPNQCLLVECKNDGSLLTHACAEQQLQPGCKAAGFVDVNAQMEECCKQFVTCDSDVNDPRLTKV